MTHKLIQAFKELRKIFNAEIPSGYILRLIDEGKIDEVKIYETLHTYGYEWQNNKWRLYKPKWIEDAIEHFENELKNRFPEQLIWAPQPESRIPVFRDYLVNMEAFIEQEVQKRRENLTKTEEKIISGKLLDTPENPSYEWELENWDLRQAEDFADILRNSFFVNLCAYVETYLGEQCDGQVNDPIIKNAVVQLIGPLRNKVPEWLDMMRFVDIRNCIVHNGGLLDQSQKNKERDDRIRTYTSKIPILKIAEKKNFYDEPTSNYELIFEKGFCKYALDTVEQFLKNVHLISVNLNRSL